MTQAESVIAGGVVSFWIVVLPTPDPNVEGNRVDFVVRLACASTPGVDAQRVQDWRIDAVRLHPGQGDHGKPVFGRLADWVTPETLADHFPDAPGRDGPWQGPGAVECTRDYRGYFGRHSIDMLGEKRPTQFTRRFLFDAVAEWNARPHPRGRFARELYDEHKPCIDAPCRFDLALPYRYRSRGLSHVWQVWDPDRQCPSLIFRLRDRSTIRATFDGGQLFTHEVDDENSIDWR